MKKIIAALSVSLMASVAYAAPVSLGIVKLEAPESAEAPYLAYATDGAIYEIDQENKELVELAKVAFEGQVQAQVEIEELGDSLDALQKRSNIEKITLATNEVVRAEVNLSEIRSTNFAKRVNYNPAVLMNDYITDLDTVENVQDVFYSMRQDTKKKSQCYNRAHAWSWEIYNKASHNGRRVQTGKIWIFFTKKYIKDYKYKWWFHIAPYLKANGQDIVIDRKFSRNVQSERQWTNTYIADNSYCPEVTRYSDHRNSQWSSNCYIMKTSVHYWQPRDIENAEKKGLVKQGWKSGEVQAAYNDAVKGYGGGWFSSSRGRVAPYL